MALLAYDAYRFEPAQDDSDFVLENVAPIYTGARISGFLKVSNCAEIADLHKKNVIGYVPEQQRGYRVKYKNGKVEQRDYLISNVKVKEIAKNIAENKENNRFRTVNCRHGHVLLNFEPYSLNGNLGRLHIKKKVHSDDYFDSLLTIPDSAHRQEGDKYFTNSIAPQSFSPEHAGFTPETYDLILHLTLTDKEGEGLAHFEYNELISSSSATRRAFLEGGQEVPENWVAHELLALSQETKELVEIYEKTISKNSNKIITFSSLSQGIGDGWSVWLSESTKKSIAQQIHLALSLAREVVPEWRLLPFAKRKVERERFLYSQAIVQRAMLRIFSEWHARNESDGCVGNWERWRPLLLKIKEPYVIGEWRGYFLSRENPLFFKSESSGLYQINRRAQERKRLEEKSGQIFSINPFTDLIIQNTRQSQALIYNHLKDFLGDLAPAGVRG